MRLLYKFDIFLGPLYQKPVDPIVEEGLCRLGKLGALPNPLFSQPEFGCSKLYSEAVYTELANGARGIPFPNDRHQGLAIEDGEDTK